MAKWFLFSLFTGGDRPTPGFIGFSSRNRFKIGKMYDALTATVYNILLCQFAYILVLKECMRHVSIYLIDGLSINSAE